jgi:hypothetical protein
MITRALYNKLETLATKQRFQREDAEELQSAIRTHISPSYSVCLRCAQQLKHGQKIIRNYLSTVQVIEDLPSVVEETIFEMAELPEPDVDIVEADKVGCTKCSRKKKTKM